MKEWEGRKCLQDNAGIDIMHACGGFARCTTCRVQFVAGEPQEMTQAEKDVLAARGLIGTAGLRLSCQINCDQDMTVKAISRLSTTPNRTGAGKRPAEEITPPAVWVAKG
jgi:ferredoxin